MLIDILSDDDPVGGEQGGANATNATAGGAEQAVTRCTRPARAAAYRSTAERFKVGRQASGGLSRRSVLGQRAPGCEVVTPGSAVRFCCAPSPRPHLPACPAALTPAPRLGPSHRASSACTRPGAAPALWRSPTWTCPAWTATSS